MKRRPTGLYSGEIIPTRCNNCVFYSQRLYSTCFGWQSHPSSGAQCFSRHSTRSTTQNNKTEITNNSTTIELLTTDKFNNNLSEPAHLWTYTALYFWWWVRLSPETCRVKPLRIKNAIVASCWTYFTNEVPLERKKSGSSLAVVATDQNRTTNWSQLYLQRYIFDKL